VICDRCGRNNPDTLVFCQDCGRRLTAAAAVVPPTPPAGLGMVDVHGAHAAAQPRMSRPPAPDVHFRVPADPSQTVCPVCSTRNPAGYSFCVSCGKRLADAAGPSAHAASPAAQLPVPPQVRAAAVVAVAPVAAEPPPDRIVCARCNGVSYSSMQFCQFCGARLATAEPVRTEQTDRPGAVAQAGMRTNQFAQTDGKLQPTLGQLVVIARDGAEGATYPLSGNQLDLGREEGTIQLADDGYVSPRHLRFLRKPDGVYARDLGSINGAYLRLKEPQQLSDGDLLLLGLQVLRFEIVKDAEHGLGPAVQNGTLVFGSPMLARHARLCERTVEGVTRNVYYLCREETVIGRESGDIVFSSDPFMSRRHASIRFDPASQTCSLADLGSSNGTFLAIRGDVLLYDGDFIRVGQHLFRFDLSNTNEGTSTRRRPT
jgi:pSer/pThr/pTyr-binding forkhead associated (FHA) protein